MTPSEQSPVFVVGPAETLEAIAEPVALGLGFSHAHTVQGDVIAAIHYLEANSLSPRFIFIDIAETQAGILESLDGLAAHCPQGTKLVISGNHNDIGFYRQLIQAGVLEYLPNPVSAADILAAFQKTPKDTAPLTTTPAAPSGEEAKATTLAFMSAAAGDGASTLAVNTAYTLSQMHKQPTILVDMDYQFGMVARNLAIQSPFGVREIFDHGDRKIDATLIGRMATRYSDYLHVISAPNDLRFPPSISPETVRDLIHSLQRHYAIVVLDIPHVWSTWTSAACNEADKIVLSAQLWLKSVTHATRLVNAFREVAIPEDKIHLVINRDGSKYKEAVSSRDFERVSSMAIQHYISNDIRTVTAAENVGETIMQQGNSDLANELKALANQLMPFAPAGTLNAPQEAAASPLSFLKKLK